MDYTRAWELGGEKNSGCHIAFIEDLLNVEGIGKKRLDEIRNLIVIGG